MSVMAVNKKYAGAEIQPQQDNSEWQLVADDPLPGVAAQAPRHHPGLNSVIYVAGSTGDRVDIEVMDAPTFDNSTIVQAPVVHGQTSSVVQGISGQFEAAQAVFAIVDERNAKRTSMHGQPTRDRVPVH